jgi:hypothetical protein
VIVINGLVGALGNPEPGTIEDALSTALQTAAWVVLWFPISLLIYDRWFYRRDQHAYRKLEALPLRVVPRLASRRTRGQLIRRSRPRQ